MLLPIEGTLSHYTVVSGYTAPGLRLFDSAGPRWLKRASCGIDIDNRRLRHRFDVVGARVMRVGEQSDSG